MVLTEGVEAGGASRAEQVEALAARLKSFYGQHAPEKDDAFVKVSQRLAQAEDTRRRSDLAWVCVGGEQRVATAYVGKEAELNKALMDKYKADLSGSSPTNGR